MAPHGIANTEQPFRHRFHAGNLPETGATIALHQSPYPSGERPLDTGPEVIGSGTVQERYTYTPFGQVTFRDGSGSTLSPSAKDWVFLHQGGEKIAAGDYEFRNRVYSPSLGRWLSNDPLGFNAGDQNWYRAVGNNPENGGDALGLTDAPFKPNDDGSRPENAGIGGFGVQRPSRPSQYIPSNWDWFEIISKFHISGVTLGLKKQQNTKCFLAELCTLL